MVKDIVELSIDGNLVDMSQIGSIAFTDNAGNTSDKIEVRVAPNFARPRPFAEITLFFKTIKDGTVVQSLNCGLFSVQTVTRANNKNLSFSATAVAFTSIHKEKRSQHYQNTTLSKVVGIVAKRLKSPLKFQTTDVQIKSLNQTNETDINFLNRLAKDYNCFFSIKNGVVYFVDRDNKDLPIATIDVSKCSSSSLKRTSKTYYKSCTAVWHSLDDGELQSVTVGDGEPNFKLDGTFKDRADAKAKAEAKLKSINKATIKGSLSLKGVALYAGAIVNIINTYKNEDDGLYSITSCTHRYGSSGWTCDVEIEN